MADRLETPAKPAKADFAEQVGIKAMRKLRARRNAPPGVWFGLGMMGLDRLVGRRFPPCSALHSACGSIKHIPAAVHGRWRCWLPGWSSAASTPGIGCDKEDRAMRNEQENDDE